MSSTKVCIKCGEEKPLTEEYFYKNKKNRDGFFGSCKICAQKAHRKWATENKGKMNQYAKDWVKRNPEKRKIIEINYRKKNSEKLKAYSKKWWEKNRER